jgi:Trypsin-like peptidase domain
MHITTPPLLVWARSWNLREIFICTLVYFSIGALACLAQKSEKEDQTPTAAQWTLNAVRPVQRMTVKSVFLLYCPKTQMKGTGFLLNSGLIVTNNHVVEGCTAQDMLAVPFSAQQFGFTKMATDSGIDLALLRPSKHLNGGLELGTDEDPLIGTQVSTWGFPLTYNGPAPLLSVGYVAGYVNDGENGKEVKHVVVNGAFNPGNSGGPLFRYNDNKVIGVVVAKFHNYPPFVKNAITTISNDKFGMQIQATDEHGKSVTVSEPEVIGAVLDQFYKTTQVMIGEAISVSELRTFIKKKQAEV